MIKFNGTSWYETPIRPFEPVVERRGALIDIQMRLSRDGQSWPDDLTEPGAWLIFSESGSPIDFIVLNEGCDSEYKFTEEEKAQLLSYVSDNRLLSRPEQ